LDKQLTLITFYDLYAHGDTRFNVAYSYYKVKNILGVLQWSLARNILYILLPMLNKARLFYCLARGSADGKTAHLEEEKKYLIFCLIADAPT
jgi:hypothetical protein